MDYSDIDLRAVLGLLRRQIRLIAGTLAVALALAVAAILLIPPYYSASAFLLFDPPGSSLLEGQSSQRRFDGAAARIESEVALVTADPVLLAVLDQMNLDPQPTLDAFRRTVSSSRRGTTYLIEISARAFDADAAAKLANTVAQTHLHQQIAAKIELARSALAVIEPELAAARDAIIASEQSLDFFILTNLERITPNQGGPDLPALTRQIAELTAVRDRNSAALAAAEDGLRRADWRSLAASLQSDALAELDRQRVTLAGSIATLPEIAPETLDLRAQLAGIEAQLQSTASSEVSRLRTDVAATGAAEAEMRQAMRSAVLDSALDPDVATDLYGLQQGADLARRHYQTLLTRMQMLQAETNLQLADSRLASPAVPPNRPASPEPPLVLAAAALAGLALGIGLAFLRDHFVGGITGAAQLERASGAGRTLAVPQAPIAPGAPSLADALVTAPLSPFAESVRRLRASIDHLPGKRTGRVIVVGSSLEGEGRTTLALALARAFAVAGRSTLLIDADLRQPSLHQQVGLAPSRGLFDYLTGPEDTADLPSILDTDPHSAATLVLGARQSEVPTDQLVAGIGFARLVRAARESFDVVILDSPPLATVTDGIFVAHHADLAVFVARAARTRPGIVRRWSETFRRALPPKTPILAILNGDAEAGGGEVLIAQAKPRPTPARPLGARRSPA